MTSNNERTLEFLREYCRKNGYPVDEPNMLEVLREVGEEVENEITQKHRWYSDSRIVRKIEGRYISYAWAMTHGDESVRDLGWDFDWSSVIEVEPYEVTVTKYREVEDNIVLRVPKD